MIWRISFVILISLFTDYADTGLADLISVTNPGFENITGENQTNEFTFGPLNGWDLYDPNNITSGGDGPTYFIGTLDPTPPIFFNSNPPEGDRVGIAFNFHGSGDQGEYGLQQTLSTVLTLNTRYTVNVEIGNIGSGTALSGRFFDLSGFPGYRVDLLAGNTLLAQDNNSLSGAIPEGEFRTSTFSVEIGQSHAELGQQLRIRLVNLNITDSNSNLGADLEVDFDDVRIDATSIPGPILAGDVNLDGVVNFFDISAFIMVLTSEVFQAEADTDDSGEVNFLDIASFIEILAL